ncbi:MAG: phage tail protein [Lachnospiraceae bacterium]|nr:phage tail protein [Butyrivibrio sp.]MCM1344030.1 phage tail protein [Muribaculaceae bacterium]MCM1411503.1 phage tail protein [Lachnospiraceae bacterium]
MYSIYADDRLIYNPSVTQFSLYDIVLSMEDNSAGSMQFSITSDHPFFEALKKLATLIIVRDGDAVLWKGRIISDDMDINHIKKVQCEGKLAFLNDSIFPAFDFSGAPDKLFSEIIQCHNSQVSDRQKFLVGNVTVKDNNDYIVRSSEYNARTWKTLKEKCFQSSLGGHLHIRYEADGDYIDWLEDYTEVSRQSITFGKNIIDLLVNSSATETFTAIRPQGAVISEATGQGKTETAGSRVDIRSVNGGRDYIVDEEKAAEYGVIFADPDESIWDDVTLPQNLLRKAREKLEAGITLKRTIDVRAVDLNLTDAEIEELKVCSYVQVAAPLHGIAEYYLLSRAEIHIDAPEHTQYTLGAVKATLTDASKMQIANVVQTVGTAIPSAVSQLRNDEGYVTEQKVIEVLKSSSVSPLIEVLEQSEKSYRLRITSISGTIETPNLIGRQGEPGTPGQDGEDGVDGSPGENAYEIAARNGFSGTEAEWLESLKGNGSSQTGLFYFECDEQGNLWLCHEDGSIPPSFEIDGEGNFYYIIPEG